MNKQEMVPAEDIPESLLAECFRMNDSGQLERLSDAKANRWIVVTVKSGKIHLFIPYDRLVEVCGPDVADRWSSGDNPKKFLKGYRCQRFPFKRVKDAKGW